MGTKRIRIVALFLLLLIAAIMFATIRIIPGNQYQIIDAPFYYKDACIYDTKTQTAYSIEKFVHTNGELVASSLWNEPIMYRVSEITYEFFIDNIERPTFKFYVGETEYSISDDGNDIVYRRLTGWRPIGRENVICPLPSSDSFYSAISIANMDGCGLLLMEPTSEDESSYIRVWIQAGGEWKQAVFCLPDGRSFDSLKGYARRHSNQNAELDEHIGDLEIGLFETDCFTLYSVVFSNDQLLLIPSEINPGNLQNEWEF